MMAHESIDHSPVRGRATGWGVGRRRHCLEEM